jgi:cell division septum initiation protein DivIVA
VDDQIGFAPAEHAETLGTGEAFDEILAQLEEQIRDARSMPLSASAMVDRKHLLALIEEARRILPDELRRAREVIRDREGLLAAARTESERVINRTMQQREELVSQTEIVQAAAREADKIVGEAKQAAARIRAEAEEYVEAKLANFEVVLTKTLQTVEKGRQRMAGQLEADRLVAEDPFTDPEGY